MEADYQGFLSYATASDYQTARRVESFLESFHKVAPAAGAAIRPLEICRDGSDFTLPKAAATHSAEDNPIWRIIVSKLEKARYLLVLCSPAAVASPWVAREVAWFIENRGPEWVLPLVTAAADPVHRPQECFPAEILGAEIHTSTIWYDLRGYHSPRAGERVRDYEDELVRLAGDLLGWDPQTSGALSSVWQREQLKRRRRQATLAIGVASILIVLAVFAIWKALDARAEALRARVASLITAAASQRDPATRGLILGEVVSLSGKEPPYGAASLAASVTSSLRPVAILRGHRGAVVSVAFSHRGDSLVTASEDGTARIWPGDLKGAPIVLTGSGSSLVEAGFSHDDQRVVTAAVDGTARIWNASGGSTQRLVLSGHTQRLRSARFSPDDSRVVTASDDHTVRLWSVANAASLAVFQEHTGPVNVAVFNHAGTVVATASEDGYLKTWPLDGVSAPRSFGYPRFQKLSGVVWSPNDSQLLVASSEGTGWIWPADRSSPPITLPGSSDAISSAAFSPDGKWVALGQFDGIHVWAAERLTPLSRSNENPSELKAGSPVRKVVFSPDSSLVAGISEDGSTRLWTVADSSNPLILGWHEGPVLDIAFSPDGKRIATASADSTVRVWRLNGPREPVVAELHKGPIAEVQLDSSGSRAMTRTNYGVVSLWRREGDAFVRSDRWSTPVLAASLNPSGTHIATAASGGEIRVSAIEKANAAHQVATPSPDARIAAVNPTGHALLTISPRDIVQLWQLETTTAPVVFRGHQGKVNSARFSADSSRVVTTGADKTVRVWSVADVRNPVVLSGHNAAVTDAWFSADGNRVISVSEDGTARVWDAAGKRQPIVLRGHPGPVYCAAFSGDGSKVVTGSEGQARVWSLDRVDTPLDLHVPDAKLWSVAFNRDATETITASALGEIRIWHTGWDWLADAIKHGSQACLSVDQRVGLLGEISSRAETEFRNCEQSWRNQR